MMLAKDYIDTRVDGQIQWMEKKSGENQKRYKQFKMAEIIAAAAIPFLAGLQFEGAVVKVIIGILGVALVVMNGLQQLYKYHENWIGYRGTVEVLRREKILFETQIGPYSSADSFTVFVQNFEALLANENTVWRESVSQKVSENKP